MVNLRRLFGRSDKSEDKSIAHENNKVTDKEDNSVSLKAMLIDRADNTVGYVIQEGKTDKYLTFNDIKEYITNGRITATDLENASKLKKLHAYIDLKTVVRDCRMSSYTGIDNDKYNACDIKKTEIGYIANIGSPEHFNCRHKSSCYLWWNSYDKDCKQRYLIDMNGKNVLIDYITMCKLVQLIDMNDKSDIPNIVYDRRLGLMINYYEIMEGTYKHLMTHDYEDEVVISYDMSSYTDIELSTINHVSPQGEIDKLFEYAKILRKSGLAQPGLVIGADVRKHSDLIHRPDNSVKNTEALKSGTIIREYADSTERVTGYRILYSDLSYEDISEKELINRMSLSDLKVDNAELRIDGEETKLKVYASDIERLSIELKCVGVDIKETPRYITIAIDRNGNVYYETEDCPSPKELYLEGMSPEDCKNTLYAIEYTSNSGDVIKALIDSLDIVELLKNIDIPGLWLMPDNSVRIHCGVSIGIEGSGNSYKELSFKEKEQFDTLIKLMVSTGVQQKTR